MIQPDPLHLEELLHTPVRRIRPYRNNWCVETDFMWWIAKPVQCSLKAKWWYQVDNELRKRGFHSMPPMITDGSRWILTPFIQGKSCQYFKMNEVKRMVRILAHFHRVGQYLGTPPPGAAFLLSHRLARRLQEFYQVLVSVDRIENRLLRELLRETGKDFYLDGTEAWNRLEKLPFQDWIERERHLHMLAHRDLASHNWMRDQSGALWLIDFETADYDAQVGDVWQMATRILAANRYPDGGIEMILRTYEEVRPLERIEKKILAALFLYPNEFFREMLGLVEKKKGYEFSASYPYLKQIAHNRKKWKKQIAELMYW
ncbi:MAG: phosphotransferase [Thermoactinomyces sp.]